MNKPRFTVDELVGGLLSGNRMMLAKAITLIESARPEDQRVAAELLEKIMDRTGNAVRIGITGTPGVGKSTFIESFGKVMIAEGKKIAVLTVDPSSLLTKGSILGDKTRMDELSKNPSAFIRPTASGNVLGGVAGKTREAILLCEAAGFEVIIIETVGVGQSEVAVKNMVDFFLLLMLAGGGDELQGIKKGIVEMADAIAITKAEGENLTRAREAQAEYAHALHLLRAPSSGWMPRVVLCSAFENTGIREIWNMILAYKDKAMSSGHWQGSRHNQNIAWFDQHFQQLLHSDFTRFKTLKSLAENLRDKVGTNALSPYKGAFELLDAYHEAIRNDKK